MQHVFDTQRTLKIRFAQGNQVSVTQEGHGYSIRTYTVDEVAKDISADIQDTTSAADQAANYHMPLFDTGSTDVNKE